MKHIIKIFTEIGRLEYREPADCVELRLYLLSLMREFVRQYKEDKPRAPQLLKTFKELENLYKTFTALTLEPGRNYSAQFEFAKTLIRDQVERIGYTSELMHVA